MTKKPGNSNIHTSDSHLSSSRSSGREPHRASPARDIASHPETAGVASINETPDAAETELRDLVLSSLASGDSAALQSAMEGLVLRRAATRNVGDEGFSGAEDGQAKTPSNRIEGRLVLLRAILERSDLCVRPELDPHAPRGHAFPIAERALGLAPGEGEAALDELTDLGLLRREVANLVHLCGSCQRCQINFRETCPGCSSIDLEIEGLVHHFRCAYTGVESEFRVGTDLNCPKCRRELRQLGHDFERPSDTYVCRGCDQLFEDPHLEAQCLACGDRAPGSDIQMSRVHAYHATPLAERAVEVGRITGLDAEAILDADAPFATRELFTLELRREAERLRRHGDVFSVATLRFLCDGEEHAILREWGKSSIAALGELVVDALRSLDLASRLDGSRVGILFPVTGAPEAVMIKKRLHEKLASFQMLSSGFRPLVPSVEIRTFHDPRTTFQDVLDFFHPEELSEG